MAGLHGPFPPQALDHLAKGNKIAAIKAVRREYGVGLKDGMDAVEDYIRSHPDLAALYAKQAATGQRIALVGPLIAVALGVLAVLAFKYLR